jgi:hypothetical protein
MTCTACDNETHRPHLCDPCRTRLEYTLAEVDATLEDLTTTLTRQAKTAPAGGGRGSGEKPLPYHVGASEAGNSLRLILKDWCGYTLENLADQGIRAQPPMPATAQRLASFLLVHAAWLADQPEAGDALREIRAALNECRRVTDAAPEMLTLGECGNDTEGVVCTEPLRAVKGSVTTTCRTCGAQWPVQERREWMMGQAVHVEVTAMEATRVLPIEVRRITDWVARGHLDPVGLRGSKPVYALAHVQRLHKLSTLGQKLTNINKENAA